ncbi:META domain-containing protein [Marinimicrobium sp. C6131]|uniref:META domain-containing protein n=1 Tax=Marinimicrobium sp. C6131 TaxID=3022676 RepID=UPI00223D5942|nr:META domain-containing protein [Marinimicrobium sp. C6131]UZJ45491.1 META domain-containing protein [Marinimicrobium sp. C6131]
MRLIQALMLATLALSSLSACQSFHAAGQGRPVPALADFQGTWQVVSLGGDGLDAASHAFLEFSEPPRLTGNGGCNRFFGVYHYDASGLRIDSSLGSTRMACAATVMVQEEQMFQLLPQATAVQLSEPDTLVLKDAEGTELLRAIRQP